MVVMKNKVHDNEKKVADTIFAARGDLDDVLFHSYFVDGQRIHFENFKEGNEVSAGVIDMWAYSAEMEKRSLNSKANKSKFVEEMTNILFISMIFPMMLADEHYYIVCFNLRDRQIHILENMNVKDSIKNRYGRKFAHLRYLFIKYLKDNGYPHFKALDDYKVANVKMSWQTNNNYVDCGIFAMRHMEMYSGNRDFDAGFVPEGKEQKKQIEDLRKKYMTKILLSESEIEDYHRLTLKEKKMLQDKSAKNIADRASEYSKTKKVLF
ncbi:hypothetical protein CTI12_AA531940 [Artemisia annua]|uniref:Ubiquitin-like protease family profile domain-containing protein n=1 Tax=Artemisia annua TaxID=35608 RepID=A0A2U1L3V4_ARTAN|nr:hypothetical protein CTI12_AA531940 [Artemisia annua]